MPQIKVRDLSNLAVSIAPADFGSWHDVRTELMSEAKAGLKARVEAELAAAADDDELKTLRDRFSAEERSLEHSIGLLPKPIEPTLSPGRSTRTHPPFLRTTDHEVHSFSAALTIDYNFLSK